MQEDNCHKNQGGVFLRGKGFKEAPAVSNFLLWVVTLWGRLRGIPQLNIYVLRILRCIL